MVTSVGGRPESDLKNTKDLASRKQTGDTVKVRERPKVFGTNLD